MGQWPLGRGCTPVPTGPCAPPSITGGAQAPGPLKAPPRWWESPKCGGSGCRGCRGGGCGEGAVLLQSLCGRGLLVPFIKQVRQMCTIQMCVK